MRALVLCAVVLAAWPVAARADAELRIEPEGSAVSTVRLSQLGAPDVPASDYGLDTPVSGHSLDQVLRAAGVDPYRYGDVEIATAGGSATLSRDEVTGAEPPPAFFEDAAGARFVSASGAAPLAAGTAPITVRLERPGALRVSARASRTRVRVGQEVTFTATVTGAGEAVEISWYFDDGRSGSGSRVTHRFRRRGSYEVVVGATTAADEAGADATVTVQVGEAPDGPDRKGGGTSSDASAPDSGAATGDTAGGGASAGPPAAAKAPSRRRPARPKRRPQQPRRREPPVRAGDGAPERVAGTELADVSALAGPAGAAALEAARRGRPDDEPGGPVPPIVWWSLGGVGLLLAGGWLEARRS